MTMNCTNTTFGLISFISIAIPTPTSHPKNKLQIHINKSINDIILLLPCYLIFVFLC